MIFPRECGITSKWWNNNFNSVLAIVKTHVSPHGKELNQTLKIEFRQGGSDAEKGTW